MIGAPSTNLHLQKWPHKKVSQYLFAALLTAPAYSAVISTSDLGNLDLSIYGVSIVHGTDLTAPAVQEAMRNETGIFFSTVEGASLSAYDTEGLGGLDPDLERRSNRPPGENPGEWSGGNVNPTVQLGLIAIPQNRGQTALVSGTLSTGNLTFESPNDDARGVVIIYNISPDLQIGSFSVTAVDAEASDPEARFSILVNGRYELDLVEFARSTGMNPEFGNRSINNLGTVDIETLSGGAESIITSVRYEIEIENESGGSGGFQFARAEGSPVPEPATAALAVIASLGLFRRRR